MPAKRGGCSPRPRGWSRDPRRERQPRRVLPAPAGMVPWSAWRRGGFRRAPRARGDGPHHVMINDGRTGCSPRPRGWSQPRLRHVEDPVVLPAPAGMVPGAASDRRSGSCAARARGDGPRNTSPSRGRRGAPRARGDGPFKPVFSDTLGRCSPRLRGWSPCAVLPDRLASVLPVTAGAVPAPSHSMRTGGGVPPARGSSPGPRARCLLLPVVPLPAVGDVPASGSACSRAPCSQGEREWSPWCPRTCAGQSKLRHALWAWWKRLPLRAPQFDCLPGGG